MVILRNENQSVYFILLAFRENLVADSSVATSLTAFPAEPEIVPLRIYRRVALPF